MKASSSKVLPKTTRTFKSGNSIAVRIPHEFNLQAGKTFDIKQRGRELVLIEREESLECLIDIFQSMPADFFADGRVDLPLQERDFSPMFGDAPAAKKSRSATAKKKVAGRK